MKTLIVMILIILREKAKEEEEEIILFLQFGICKIGICLGLSCHFSCIVHFSNNINISNDLFRFEII